MTFTCEKELFMLNTCLHASQFRYNLILLDSDIAQTILLDSASQRRYNCAHWCGILYQSLRKVIKSPCEYEEQIK